MPARQPRRAPGAGAPARASQDQERRWQVLTESCADLVLLLDGQGRVLEAPVLPAVGADAPEHGALLRQLVHPSDGHAAAEALERVLERPGEPTRARCRLPVDGGEWRWCSALFTNRLDDPDLGAVVLAALAEAVPQASSASPQLARSHLLRRLEEAATTERACGLLLVQLLDLDELRGAVGRAPVEALLQLTMERLVDACHESTTITWYGEDTVALLRHDLVEVEQQLRGKALRLLTLASAPAQVGGAELRPRVVVGGVEVRDRQVTEVLAEAEDALARARAGGAGTAVVDVAREDRAASLARHAVRRSLAAGFDPRELVLEYSPVVELRTGAVAGVDATLRWLHPEAGSLPLHLFWPQLQHLGLADVVTRWALDRAARDAAAARTSAGVPCPVGVEVTADQLAPWLVEAAADVQARHGTGPGELLLEVVDSEVSAARLPERQDVLQALRDLGVLVVLDRFGASGSGVAQLRACQVNGLKVAPEYVAGAPASREDAAIVAAIASLAGSLGLECVAAGVASAVHRDLALSVGCGYGEGDLWGPPVAADALPELILTGAGRGPVPVQPRPVPGMPRRYDAHLAPRLEELLAEGLSLHTVAARLNVEQVPTPTGRRWTAASVARALYDLGITGR